MTTNHSTERKRELVKLYDSTAHTYDRRYKEIQCRKYRNFGSKFKKVGITLDVGCGTGLLLCMLGNRAGHIVGVDISTAMLRIASKNLRKGSVSGSLIRADAESLPFRGNVFANVASVTVLQNLTEPNRAISEIARVAVCGAQIALTCLGRKHSTAWLRKIVSSATSDLEVTSEWEDGEEDIGIDAAKPI
jgi:ubiquinone/menaquinone biosynthesis C-methylase UbiE